MTLTENERNLVIKFKKESLGVLEMASKMNRSQANISGTLVKIRNKIKEEQRDYLLLKELGIIDEGFNILDIQIYSRK